jgi:hypothetical protein
MAILLLGGSAFGQPADIAVFGLEAGGDSQLSVRLQRVLGLNGGLASYGIDMPEGTTGIVNLATEAGFEAVSGRDLAGQRASPANVGFGKSTELGLVDDPAFLEVSQIDAAVFKNGSVAPAVPVWTMHLLDVPFSTSVVDSDSSDILEIHMGMRLDFVAHARSEQWLPAGQYNYYLQQITADGSITKAAAEGMDSQFTFDTHGRFDVELWVLDEQNMPYFPTRMQFMVVPEPSSLLLLSAAALALATRRNSGRPRQLFNAP